MQTTLCKAGNGRREVMQSVVDKNPKTAAVGIQNTSETTHSVNLHFEIVQKVLRAQKKVT